jgi:ABC-type cobalamin transport system permease subunit
MLSTPAGNDAFDLPFILLELGGIVFWSLMIAIPKRMPAFTSQALAGIALGLIVGAPLFWALVFPQRSGIEGAARLILMMPLLGLNLLLAAVAMIRASRTPHY